MVKIENKNYSDVTDKWNRRRKNYSGFIVKERDYVKVNGVIHRIKKRSNAVVPNSDPNARKIANWLGQTFGGKIFINPEVHIPQKVPTSDFSFRGKPWEQKTISGNGKRIIDTRVRDGKNQASNFIFDLSNSELTTADIKRQLSGIYNAKERRWVNAIIIKRGNNYNVFSRKKRSSSPLQKHGVAGNL